MALVENFEAEWAAPGDWAAMYRAVGWQVVPSHLPDQTNWKRPALADWKSLQEGMVPDATFERWYGDRGEHVMRQNMGILTGRASGNVFVIDLDEYKTPQALSWWHGVMAEHNNDMEIETCQQVTGGGGRQLFFRAPAGWNTPTNKTPIGVDVRGQGGFAVLPPSRHVSGQFYAWKPGASPWECEIAEAPVWLLEAVSALVERYGGDSSRQEAMPVVTTASPSTDVDAFGARVDGRDHYMRDLIWAAVANWHRECPIPPSEAESQSKMREVWSTYERKTKTRLPGDNVAGLEREGRGPTAFTEKWRRAMSKWSTDIAEAAQRPLAVDEAVLVSSEKQPRGRFVFEKTADLRRLPPAQWLVKGWIPDGGTGIFYGKWAAGKSFIGFDLGLHLAYGMTDWHGAELPGESCHVLVIAREGHQGFVNRVDAFKAHYGLPDDTDHLTFMRGSVSFMRDEDFAGLVEAIKAIDTPFKLIVVDTVARVLPGVDMNEQQTVTTFMERIAVLGQITSASVIGVHHQNKNGGMMGSAFFEANSDFVFEISRDGEEGPLSSGEIMCTKMKDAEDGWKKAVGYSKIALSVAADGPSSLVVRSIGEAAEKVQGGAQWPDKLKCQRVLAAIREAWFLGKPWSTSPQTQREGRYGPRLMVTQFEIPAMVAKNMLETWLENKVLAVEMASSKSKLKGLQVIGNID